MEAGHIFCEWEAITRIKPWHVMQGKELAVHIIKLSISEEIHSR